MEQFIKKEIGEGKFELTIDTNIFSKDIVLKSAYNFLDKGYFFFRILEDNNILLQFTQKEDNKLNPEKIILEFGDELLSVYLRDRLEKDNKEIRERIISIAISSSLDTKNYVTIDSDSNIGAEIDFDKDIDEILKEIESDPDLKIDEEEIARILKEIEEESQKENEITLDINAVKDVKKKFSNR